MNEIFLLKLGEIVLKGQNRKQFENKLRQNVRRRMKTYGEFDVYIIQSPVYVLSLIHILPRLRYKPLLTAVISSTSSGLSAITGEAPQASSRLAQSRAVT